MLRRSAPLLLSILFCTAVHPQTVPLSNPSFEEGANAPAGWTLSSGQGEWLSGDASEGRRAIAVTGEGEDTNYWRSAPLPLNSSKIYRLAFRARSIDATAGTPITGPVFCNRDLGSIAAEWTRYHSIFVTPEALSPERAWLRFGQWHADGSIAFDRIELTAARPLYTSRDGIVLGEGERIAGRRYTFTAPFHSASRNHSRPLVRHDCDFNTYRWVFGADSYLLYRHEIAGRTQTAAELRVSVGYHVSGSLTVEASADGDTWRTLGTIASRTGDTLPIPADLFPASAVWIRLRASSGRAVGTESDPGSFQVDAYEYRADLAGPSLDLEGSTHFVAISASDPRLAVRIADLGEAVPGGANIVALTVDNTTDSPLSVRPLIRIAGESDAREYPAPPVALKPGPSTLDLPYEIPGAGTWNLEIALSGDASFTGRIDLHLAALYETAYGAQLPASDDRVGLWTASSGWKISRTRPVPVDRTDAVRIAAARNEAEAAQLVVRYHHLTNDAQKRAVLDRYLESFSAHRISPYDPAPLDRFTPTWDGLNPHFDWNAWDAAMTRAIDHLGFNSFRLRIQGLGGGTFQSRVEPELIGYGEDTPEYGQALRAYLRQIEDHLRARGWLDEAYVYWFDEPAPRDYDFVINGFRKLRENAPGLNRMLTEQVEPELVGSPNIWCPVSDAFDPERSAARMRAGDTFWWYVCTGPKAPYAGLFIDHPGTELRVWLWQTWQYGIEGILVWQSNYWTSGAAYPNSLQNPYLDPMGWVSSYSAPVGTRNPWGNGDGRFLYPPEAAAEGTQEYPVIDGPVASIRWEMLRDGVEDYEYFAILRKLLAARKDLSATDRNAYEQLLIVPSTVTESMTRFTRDPAPIEAHRRALARAIATLTTDRSK